jgi:hypothetical protein
VALGGTLHQAVQEVPGLATTTAPDSAPAAVQYGPCAPGARAAGRPCWKHHRRAAASVNSVHGQGVKRWHRACVWRPWRPMAWSRPFRSRTAPGFNLCVQWHPEWQAADNPVSMQLLQAFGARRGAIPRPRARAFATLCRQCLSARAAAPTPVQPKHSRTHAETRPKVFHDRHRDHFTFSELEHWLDNNRVTEIECLVPDLTGVARGKILPRQKFTEDRGMRLPEAVVAMGVTGEFPEEGPYYDVITPTDRDMHLRPDPTTVRIVPWATDPTAQVIHDCYDRDGVLVPFAPRSVLRHVCDLLTPRAGRPWWRPSWSSTWWRATPTPTCRSSPRWAAAAAAKPRARPTASTR